MTPSDTWALTTVKRWLLEGRRFTQADLLEATGGHAWRLSAAIWHLRHYSKWDVLSETQADGCALYWLSRAEIRRIRKAMQEAA